MEQVNQVNRAEVNIWGETRHMNGGSAGRTCGPQNTIGANFLAPDCENHVQLPLRPGGGECPLKDALHYSAIVSEAMDIIT